MAQRGGKGKGRMFTSVVFGVGFDFLHLGLHLEESGTP